MTLQWCYITAMTSNVTGSWNVCSAACFRFTAKKRLRITGSCRGFPSQGGSVENGSISWCPHWIAIRSRNPICGNGHQNIHFFLEIGMLGHGLQTWGAREKYSISKRVLIAACSDYRLGSYHVLCDLSWHSCTVYIYLAFEMLHRV